MKGVDWLSERMVFGVLIIMGYLLTIGTVVYFTPQGVAHDVVVGGVGTLGTALGMVVQSVFRTDKTDRASAEAMAALAKSVTSTQ